MLPNQKDGNNTKYLDGPIKDWVQAEKVADPEPIVLYDHQSPILSVDILDRSGPGLPSLYSLDQSGLILVRTLNLNPPKNNSA